MSGADSNLIAPTKHSASRKDVVSKESKTNENELWENIPNSSGVDRAEKLISLSHIAYDRGDYRSALALCESAKDIYISHKNEVTTGTMLHVYEGITWSLKKLNRNGEAAEAALIAAKSFVDDDRSAAASMLRDAGRSFFNAGDFENSLECYKQLFCEVDPEITEWLIGSDHYNCATASIELRKYEEAISDLLKARQCFKEEKQPENVYICDEYLSRVYTDLGNGVEAVLYGQRALDFAVLSKNPIHESTANYQLGCAKVLMGETDLALELLNTALTINANQAEPDWDLTVRANKQIAQVLTIKGKISAAEDILRRIRTLEETICDN